LAGPLTVTNAANHEKDLAWFREHASDFEVEVGDRLESYAMLAVQGPNAREIVGSLAGAELPARMGAEPVPFGEELQGVQALVCGTGYTGEDGVEILVAPEAAPALWDALVTRGAAPAGLAARDTLRTEVCFHLYGNDMDESRNPIEAGLGWCCKEETGFIGSDVVAAAREGGTEQKLAAFALTGPGIPRQGNGVVVGDEQVGTVTSGTYSPSLEQGIGMAYVRADVAVAGTDVEIDVRGKRRPARIESKPLYDPKQKAS
jgi:aminomethyltransferase